MRTRRSIPWAAVAATLALATPAPAALRPGAGDARARLVSCHRALAPSQRSMTVEGSMRALGPGERMGIRFDLSRRAAGEAGFVRVTGPGLGVYKLAAPGVGSFRFVKRIENLAGTADYRVAVTMRWLAADGSLVASAVRRAPACHEVELRPDLRVAKIDVSADRDGAATYTVTVRNDAASTRSGFGVALSVAGVDQPPASVRGLAGGAERDVVFRGPRCPAGSIVEARVDPDRRVPEVADANNRRAVSCPAVEASSAGH